jgi:epoxyqueuosine reductase QueG
MTIRHGHDFKAGADAFVAKLGVLATKIATNIGEIVDEYLAKKAGLGFRFL